MFGNSTTVSFSHRAARTVGVPIASADLCLHHLDGRPLVRDLSLEVDRHRQLRVLVRDAELRCHVPA